MLDIRRKESFLRGWRSGLHLAQEGEEEEEEEEWMRRRRRHSRPRSEDTRTYLFGEDAGTGGRRRRWEASVDFRSLVEAAADEGRGKEEEEVVDDDDDDDDDDVPIYREPVDSYNNNNNSSSDNGGSRGSGSKTAFDRSDYFRRKYDDYSNNSGSGSNGRARYDPQDERYYGMGVCVCVC